MNQTPPLTTQSIVDQVQSMAEQAENTGMDVVRTARRVLLAYAGAAVVMQEETEKAFDMLVRRGEQAKFGPIDQINAWMKRTQKQVEQAESHYDEMVQDLQNRLGVASEDDVRHLTRQIEVLNAKVDAYITEAEAERKADERRAAQKRAAEVRAAEEAYPAEELPIANYDRMTVDQVVSRLDQLSVEQLRALRAYEEENKKRISVLRAMDERLNALLPIEGYDELTTDEVEREIHDLSVDELRAIRHYEVEHKNRKSLLENVDRRIAWLMPISEYDSLNVDETATRLEGLKIEDLRRVRQYEVEHKNRHGVIEAIDKRLATLEQQEQ